MRRQSRLELTTTPKNLATSTLTCIAKVTRRNSKSIYQSSVRYQGKQYRKSTHTRIRKAALEFNAAHLRQIIINGTDTVPTNTDTEPTTTNHTPDLLTQ